MRIRNGKGGKITAARQLKIEVEFFGDLSAFILWIWDLNPNWGLIPQETRIQTGSHLRHKQPEGFVEAEV
jgi:hypothetical protein